MEPKKLYRSTSDKMISGVCGGLANYLSIDATVIRLLWVILGFTAGFGIIAYIIAVIIIPSQP